MSHDECFVSDVSWWCGWMLEQREAQWQARPESHE